jgi:hypothetical protein
MQEDDTSSPCSSNKKMEWNGNIFMEQFEKLALDAAPYKPLLWLRYVDDTFVVWPHGLEQLHIFLGHLNSLRPSIRFTMETE